MSVVNMNTQVGIYYTEENNEIIENEFSYYTDLRATDRVSFVNSVVDTIVQDGIYAGTIKDMIFDFMLVKFFTDIPVEEMEKKPNFLNDIEEFVYGTSVVTTLYGSIRPGLIDELRKSVDENIAYRTGIRISVVENAVASLLNTLENRMAEIDPEDIAKIAQMASNMNDSFTPDAIIEAYQKTDAFKVNETKREMAVQGRVAASDKKVVEISEAIDRMQNEED